MAIYYVNHNASTLWSAAATFAVSAMVRPTFNVTAAQRGYVYEATAITTGITGGTEPTWPTTSGGTVVDGGVTWTVRDGISTGGWTKAVGSVAHILQRAGTFSPLAIGDKIFVASNHSETISATQNWGVNGTDGLSLDIISVNTGTNAYSRGAAFVSATGIGITLRAPAIFRGLDFNVGAGTASAASFVINDSSNRQWYKFEDCTFFLNNTSVSSRLGAGSVSPVLCEFTGCTFRFGSVSQKINFSNGLEYVFRSCSLHASSSAVATLIDLTSVTGTLRCYGCDWTGAASTAKVVDQSGVSYNQVYLDDCKLPASYADMATTSAWQRLVVRGWPARYSLRIKEQYYTLTTDTATYRNTADGATFYSWKVVTGTGSAGVGRGYGEWRSVYISATGSKTITVDTLIDAAAGLTDSEIWLEVDAQSTSSQVYTTSVSDWSAPPGVAQTSGTASEWTKAAPVTGWIAQRLAVTVTVNVTGFLRYRVFVNKISTTVYIDPKAAVS